MYVMEVLLRGPVPLCLMFATEVEAHSSLERFDADIAGAPDGSLLTIVQDDGRCVAFLKRDFRCIEIARHPDHDGEEADDDDDGHEGSGKPGTPDATERPGIEIQRLRSPLDVALNDAIAPLGLGRSATPRAIPDFVASAWKSVTP